MEMLERTAVVQESTDCKHNESKPKLIIEPRPKGKEEEKVNTGMGEGYCKDGYKKGEDQLK